VLHLVSHLSATIINVVKRLVLILAGLALYHQVRAQGNAADAHHNRPPPPPPRAPAPTPSHRVQKLHPVNTVGIVLASGGILWYNIVKEVAGASGSGGLGAPVNVWSPASWLAWVGTVVWKFEHPRNNGGGGGGGGGRSRSTGSGAGSGSEDAANGRSSKRKGALAMEGRLGWAVRSAGAIGGGSMSRGGYAPSPSGLPPRTPARTSPPTLTGGFAAHHTVLEMVARGVSESSGSGNDAASGAVRSPRARQGAGTPAQPPRGSATPAWLMGPVTTQLLSPPGAGWASAGTAGISGGGHGGIAGAGAVGSLAHRTPQR
jgi:hypothetical protein